jgi:outer membrane murein-binding lipoprotein Lpp
MTKLILGMAVVTALLVSTGCNKSNDTGTTADSSSTNGGSVLTAPVDYLNEAAKAQKTAVKAVDTAALKSAIQMFNVQEGRNPKDLNELVSKKYIPSIPTPPVGMKINYDAASGSVSIVKE